jgi:hypothetical protein
MFGSGILDTVIGLVFIFLLVSLLVTIVNEMIAAAFMSRAKWLRRGIDRLIGTDWMRKVYDHPLIEGTGRKNTTLVPNPGPSYIPSRSFANVLMSIVQQNAGAFAECQQTLRSALDKAASPGATPDSLKAQLAAAAGELQKKGDVYARIAGDLVRYLDASGPNTRGWLDELNARITELRNAGKADLQPLLDTLARLVADGFNTKTGVDEVRTRFDAAVADLLTGPDTAALKAELTAMGKRLKGPYTVAEAYADIHWFIDGFSVRNMRQMLEALPDDDLKTALLTLYQDANNDVEKFKESIEVWFNNAMDRVNGWYKRQSQLVISGLALVTAVAMNVDTILILKHLQTYPAAREALVGQAAQFAQKNPVPMPGDLTVANQEAFSGYLQLKPADSERTVAITSDNPDVKVRMPSVKVDKGAIRVPFTVDVDMGPRDQPGTATIKSSDATDEIKLTLTPSLFKQFDTVQKKVADLTIPVGWVREGTGAEKRNGQVIPGFFEFGYQLGLLRQHALGWLLTALAATLGAPFWFDMLNRVISIRATGKPPEEEPKPPKAVPVPVEPGQSQQEADRLRQSGLRSR